jgi:hypothetical protein
MTTIKRTIKVSVPIEDHTAARQKISQDLVTAIMTIAQRSADFKFAEAAELGIEPDNSCGTAEWCKNDLNKQLAVLWKMISNEPKPKDLEMVMSGQDQNDQPCAECENPLTEDTHIFCCTKENRAEMSLCCDCWNDHESDWRAEGWKCDEDEDE